MYVYVNLDFKRVNVEYARGTLDYYHYDTSSRTRGIRTVSLSCEYACGYSKHQIHEKLVAPTTRPATRRLSASQVVPSQVSIRAVRTRAW